MYSAYEARGYPELGSGNVVVLRRWVALLL